MLLPGIGPGRIDQLIGDEKPWASWRQIWESINGVTEDMVEGWKKGLAGGVKVHLNGSSEWE
jgi:hypothetical protein